jgi:hypothetical protein
MVASSSNGSPNRLYTYLQTVLLLSVTVYNNNTAIGTVIISKGNPQAFDVPMNLMIGQNTTDK